MAETNKHYMHTKELLEKVSHLDPSDSSEENLGKIHFGQRCAWCMDNATLWLVMQIYKKLRKKGLID